MAAARIRAASLHSGRDAAGSGCQQSEHIVFKTVVLMYVNPRPQSHRTCCTYRVIVSHIHTVFISGK